MSQLSVTPITHLSTKFSMMQGFRAFTSRTLLSGFILGSALVGASSFALGYEYTSTSSNGMALPFADFLALSFSPWAALVPRSPAFWYRLRLAFLPRLIAGT